MNEYEDLANKAFGAPADSGNEYDSIIGGLDDMRKQALAQSTTVASMGPDPERSAKVRSLADKSKLPFDIVDRHYDQIAATQKPEWDYDSILKNTPKTAEWMSNPDNARVALDDVDAISQFEKSMVKHSAALTMYNSLNSGIYSLAKGAAEVPAFALDLSATIQNVAVDAVGLPEYRARFAPESLRKNVVTDFLDEQAKTWQTPEMQKSVSEEIGKGNYSDAGFALANQIVANAPMQAALIASVVAGYGVPGLVGAGALAGAQSATEAQEKVKSGEVSAETATAGAAVKGVIEAAFERMGTTGAFKAMVNQLEKQFGKQASKAVTMETMKTMMFGAVQEGKEEAATSIAQDFTDYLTGVNPDALVGIDQRALDAGFVGAGSGTTMTAPAAVAQSLQQVGAQRRTQMAKDFYMSMGTSAESTKLRARLPEAQKQFIGQLTKDSPVENIFVAAEALDVLFQDENPVKKMQEIGILDAYTQAKETGTDVKIPLATWVDKVPAEIYGKLADDVKFDPGALSVNEVKAQREETARVLEQEAKKAEEAGAKEATTEQSAKAIGNAIADQLKAAGQDDQAAVIIEKFFSTLSSRYQDAGISLSPEALFNQYKLSVAQGNEIVANGNTLSQSELGPQLSNHLRGISPKLRNALIGLGSIDQSISSQPIVDGGGVGSENLTQLLESDSTVIKEGSLSELPSLFSVLSHMRAVILENPKILDAIVGAVPVKMVNDLFGSKRAAKVALHNEAMLKDGSAFDTELPVSSDGHGNSPVAFLIHQAARAATELARKSSNPRLESQESLAASKTGNGNRLSQEGTSGPRAQIALLPESAIITLSKSADSSSFFHEASHYFFEFLTRLNSAADTPQTVKDDYQTLLKWLEVKEGEAPNDPQLEQFARGFEAYVMEGNAPSSKLKKAFDTFRVWLISVYRQLEGLNVELTPEVRAVMDRMLATEEEIAAARQQVPSEPLFKEPANFNMVGAKAERYQKAVLAARQFTQEEMSKRLMRDLAKKQTAEYKAQRKEIHDEVEKEIAAIPAQRALSVLQKGTLPDGSKLPDDMQAIKLDRASVNAIRPASELPRGITATDGVDVSIVAEGFGYASAEEFLNDLGKTKPFNEAVEAATDDMMRALHPELLGTPQATEEAIKSLHNEARAEMLHMELEHLVTDAPGVFREVVRRTVRRPPTVKEVRAQAEGIIGRQMVRDIRPAMYLRAEVKSAKEAGDALAKGDIEGAAKAKQRELLNHELFRAATQAREELDKSKPLFKKFFRKNDDLAKSRNMDLVNAGRAILAEFGVGKTDKTAVEYLAPIKTYDPETYATMEALVLAATEKTGDYENLSYDDFSAMKTAVEAIWELSKNIMTLEIDGKKVSQKQATGEMKAVLADRMKPGNVEDYRQSADKWEKTKRALLGLRAMGRRTESWIESVQGGYAGALRKYLFEPITKSTAAYRLAKVKYLKKYLELTKGLGSMKGGEILAPELKHRFRNKAELLGMLLHIGNDSNKSKLIRGYGWGEVNEDGTVDSTKLDAFRARLETEGILTKKDYDFIQGVWDLFEEIKPQAQKAHKAMYGFYFNEITANEFSTPFGIYRGGYAPAKVDPYASEDASVRAEKEQLERSNNSFAFPTSGRGATKTRVDAYAAPLQMDLGLVASHIDWALKFAHIEPAVKAASKMLWNKEFQDALYALDPAIRSDMLIPWLQRTAQQMIEEPSKSKGGKGLDWAFRTVRRRSGLNIMFFNVVNTFEQFTGLSLAAVKVKPKHLRNALWTYARSPKETADAILEKSPYMQTRMKQSSFEVMHSIEELLLEPTKFEQARDFAAKHGYFMQHATQGIVDTVTWSGAYNQAIENGATESAAILEADSAVRLTQGSAAAEDISRLETGTPFIRLFTMFWSYFNMQANLLGTEGRITQDISREMGLKKGAGRALYVYTFGFLLMAMASASLRKLAGGGFDEDDDDEYLDDFMDVFFNGQFRLGLAMVPGAGQFAMAGVNRLNEKWYDDRVNLSPAVQAIEGLVGAPASVYKAMFDDGSKKAAIRDTLSAVGLLTGFPVAPLSKPLGYLSDVDEGKANPTGPIDFARGLVTGRSGQ